MSKKDARTDLVLGHAASARASSRRGGIGRRTNHGEEDGACCFRGAKGGSLKMAVHDTNDDTYHYIKLLYRHIDII